MRRSRRRRRPAPRRRKAPIHGMMKAPAGGFRVYAVLFIFIDMPKMNPVVHFEMPAENKDRMCTFYETAFGWQTMKPGPEMGNYVIATTTETDERRMVKTPGAINGGFFDKSAPDQHARITISVDDIKEAMKRVAAAGGKVLGGMQKPGEPGVEGYVKHGKFALAGIDFIAMDSSGPHDFTFTEATSFVVHCADQDEVGR